jgi:outer membrane protein TolC
MRYGFLWIMLLGIEMSLWACAGHQDVIREMEDYRPPVLYQADKNVPEPRTPLDQALEDKAFLAQKEKLEEIRKDWEKTLASPPKETSFFTPDPDRLKIISNAFNDDEAAQNFLSNGFSLGDFEILTAGRNATIKNAEKTFLATLETYSQASVLDDIIRSYSAFNAGIMTGVGNMEDMESIYRKFPFPGILSLKGDIVHEEVKIALMDFEIVKRTIITEARKNFQELIYNAAAKEIAGRTLGLLEELESSVTRRYETGQSLIPELTLVKIQKEKMKVELLTISEKGLNIEKKMKSLLLLPASTKIGTPARSDADKRLLLPAGLKLDDLIEAALKHRQELKKIQIMITRMELMIEMAETEIYPGVTPNLALTENRAVTGTGTMKMEEPFSVTVSASMGSGLPRMPWTNLSEAYLRETRQRLLALKEELKSYEAETAADIREAWFSVDRARREAALYGGEIESLSRLNFSVSSKAYESGSIAFSDTMDAVLLMFETQLTTERKKADLFVALAELYKTVGVSKEVIKKEKDGSHAE